MDHLIKATAEGIRIFAAVTTDLVNEAGRRHDCYPVAAAALGRALTGAALLAADLKNSECLTVKISGDGSLGNVVADASNDGFVRGYVDVPHVDLPIVGGKLPVGAAVGRGLITVTRFTGLKQPFTGACELVSGEIAEDLTQYLYVSEQTQSSIGLGVLADQSGTSAAGGFFVQALPDVADEALTRLEANIAKLPPVSSIIKSGQSARALIKAVLDGFAVNFHENTALQFRCQCSEERIKQALLSLSAADLQSLVDDGFAEVACHFCGDKFTFTREQLIALQEQADDRR